jgi:hypothetical protein
MTLEKFNNFKQANSSDSQAYCDSTWKELLLLSILIMTQWTLLQADLPKLLPFRHHKEAITNLLVQPKNTKRDFLSNLYDKEGFF